MQLLRTIIVLLPSLNKKSLSSPKSLLLLLSPSFIFLLAFLLTSLLTVTRLEPVLQERIIMTTEEVDFGCCEFCGCQYLSAHGKKRHERLNHLHKMNSSLSMPDEPPIVDVAPLPAVADTRPLLHLEADMSLDTIPDCFRTVHSNNWALEFDSEPDWSDTGADLSNMSIDPSVLGKLTPPTTHLGFHNSEPSDQESEQSFPNPTSMEAADPSKYEDRGSPSFCDSDDTSHQSSSGASTTSGAGTPGLVG